MRTRTDTCWRSTMMSRSSFPSPTAGFQLLYNYINVYVLSVISFRCVNCCLDCFFFRHGCCLLNEQNQHLGAFGSIGICAAWCLSNNSYIVGLRQRGHHSNGHTSRCASVGISRVRTTIFCDATNLALYSSILTGGVNNLRRLIKDTSCILSDLIARIVTGHACWYVSNNPPLHLPAVVRAHTAHGVPKVIVSGSRGGFFIYVR